MRPLLLALVVLVGCGPSGFVDVEPVVDTGEELGSDVSQALRVFDSAEVTAMGFAGVPQGVRGSLGQVDGLVDAASLSPHLNRVAAVFRLGAQDLKLRGVASVGETRHFKYQQMKDGLEVVGGDLVLHVDRKGRVYTATGLARGLSTGNAVPDVSGQAAVDTALRDAVKRGGTELEVTALPTLSYVLAETGAIRLAWRIELSGEGTDAQLRDSVFIDAKSGAMVAVHPHVHTVLSRRVHDAKSGQTLPGQLARTETGQPSADVSVEQNFGHLGSTYKCYQELFNRDSIDGNGLQLVSSVHFRNKFNNAQWNGSQMLYGDGDGVTFSDLSRSLDVTAHELTHGVTQSTSGLIYQGQSGALNEAMSDIFAAICESHARGGVIDDNTWLVGEEIFTPATPGDALRYMGNPTLDNVSKDFYPERYTASGDNGGVHFNSGIPNLVFKLLVTGGTHPRAKTTVSVPAIGIAKAAAIFYRSQQTGYLTSSSNFEAARAATAQAAADLFTSVEQAAVQKAWDAVAVPGGAPTTPPPTGGTVLTSGVPVTALRGARLNEARFTLVVPAGATKVTFAMSGGTGDADLYVRRTAPPTLTTYDFRPYLNGNAETVTVNAPAAGTYHVMVQGFSAYTGVTLTATIQ